MQAYLTIKSQDRDNKIPRQGHKFRTDRKIFLVQGRPLTHMQWLIVHCFVCSTISCFSHNYAIVTSFLYIVYNSVLYHILFTCTVLYHDLLKSYDCYEFKCRIHLSSLNIDHFFIQFANTFLINTTHSIINRTIAVTSDSIFCIHIVIQIQYWGNT